MINPYKILGVERNATADEIKKAYKGLAQKHHPDKSNGDEERFKEINLAYDILYDAKKREEYDRTGDVKKATSITNQAINLFMNTFVARLAGTSHLLGSANPFDQVRNDITRYRNESKNSIPDIKNRKERLEKRYSKVKNINDHLNLIKNWVIDAMASLDMEIEKKKEQIEVSDEALKFCDKYQYDDGLPKAAQIEMQRALERQRRLT